MKDKKNWRVTIDRNFCPYLLNEHECRYKKDTDETGKEYECSFGRCPIVFFLDKGYHNVDKFYKE